jgi:hypothetical protein
MFLSKLDIAMTLFTLDPWIRSIFMYNITAYLEDEEETNADFGCRWLSVMYKPCNNNIILEDITCMDKR